jgi:DNA-binding NtrC family response regulator
MKNGINKKQAGGTTENITMFTKKVAIFSLDADFCKNLTLLFRSRYQVSSANSVDELIQCLIDEKINLLLIDSTKLDKDFLLFIKKVKKSYPNILIVLLYVFKYSEGEIEKQFRQYVDVIMYKPVDATQMMSAIDGLLMKNGNAARQ